MIKNLENDRDGECQKPSNEPSHDALTKLMFLIKSKIFIKVKKLDFLKQAKYANF